MSFGKLISAVHGGEWPVSSCCRLIEAEENRYEMVNKLGGGGADRFHLVRSEECFHLFGIEPLPYSP